VQWVRRFILFHGKRHPAELGAEEITEFLNHLATQRHVTASTQNQALNAIVFLYRRVLGRDVDELGGLVRARKARRLPVVLTRREVVALLEELSGTQRLVASLLCDGRFWLSRRRPYRAIATSCRSLPLSHAPEVQSKRRASARKASRGLSRRFAEKRADSGSGFIASGDQLPKETVA
jgi:integrase